MKRIILLLLSLCSYFSQAENLQFNEIMPSNIDCYFIDHDFPDSWIELYNPTSSAIDLYHYYLGTDEDLSTAYRFSTHTTISAKGYLVIPCDKQGSNLHTDFNLNTDKEGQIYLFDANGTCIDILSYPEMIAPNVAFGRKDIKSNDWGWEVTPTPKKANAGVLTNTLLPHPTFSTEGKPLEKSVTLTISLPQETIPADSKIFYTTDGSEPTSSSASGTNISLTLSESTVVRAKLMSSEAVSPRAKTHSFIFHNRETQLPIVSIATNDDYLYSSDMGILSSAKTDGQENYNYDWRRPLNIEYFRNSSSESADINQICETAVSGCNSRSYAQKSLKVYAKKRFGKSKLKHKYFWAEKESVKSVKSLVLRNGGNNANHARINDAFLQRLFGWSCSSLDYQSYSPVIVYINGQYRGEYELRERSNDDFVESNYPEVSDYYMATEASLLSSNSERSSNTFDVLYNLYTKNNTTYAQLAELIDIDNFRDALIAEMFATNHDYPHNNVSMWRPEDGKWRWILKDLDFFAASSSTPASFNMLKYMTGTVTTSDPEYTLATRSTTKQAVKLYKKMLSLPEFYNNFIDAFSTYLGDFLKPQYSQALIEEMVQEIEDEIEDTFATYSWSTSQFYSKINRLKTYSRERPRYIYQHIADHFSLGSVIPMSLDAQENEVSINGFFLNTGSFDGAYYSNRQLLLNSGSTTKGWKMTTYKRNSNNKMIKNSTEVTFDQSEISLELKNYANCDSVVFSLISITPSTISHSLTIGEGEWATLCVPFSFQIPSALAVYSVVMIDPTTHCLVLEPVSTPIANKPYLINGIAGNYTISGIYTTASSPLVNGLLTGTDANTYAPANSYVLQYLNNTIGFYHVSEDNVIPVPSYHAYLTTDVLEQQGPIRIPDEGTAIIQIKNQRETTNSRYTLFGQPLDKKTSGFNLIKQTNGSFRVEYE